MNPPFPTTGGLRWSYAINCWKPGFMGFARVEEHERAFKTMSAAGFGAVELKAGSGRWDTLGRPENIVASYGSLENFRDTIGSWGMAAVSSVFLDPFQMSFEDLHFGLDPLNESQRSMLTDTAVLHSRALATLGGDWLVVRPVASFSKQGALSRDQLLRLGEAWTAIGKGTRTHGIGIALHVDALSALRSIEDLEVVLEALDPAVGGLALDTAELTMAGHDVAAFYEHFHDRIVHCHFKDALAVDELDEYRLPNAERALVQSGGSRGIRRWFAEMGTSQGHVDFERLARAMVRHHYRGWVVVESDGGPSPVAAGVMSNGWYVRQRLLPVLAPIT
ncbi:MAG: hypothetical protein RJB26_1987 [Pseudomonadota bacterium]